MSKNPYAAPAAPVPPPIRKPSKVGLRHYFLLLFTWLVGLYVVQAWPVLWLVASSDAHGMLIGLLALIGASGLLLGLARSMYRPWLGRTAFCIALAALALGFAVLIWGGSGQDVGPLELGFAVVMVLAMGLSVWGALMSFLAVKGG